MGQTSADVVVLARFFRKTPALLFHLMGGLPCAGYDFAEPPHGLTIRRHHGKRAQIMQDILGGNGLSADTAFGESKILGD